MEEKDNLERDENELITVNDMYEGYFLDYASYVILERAVPHINDGYKPVQRRLLHSMKQMDDGRFHKVANIIGQTMQYHPHGDASIGAALVNLGQKDLLVECQGNWGDIRTGDSSAAPRYIEARLSKFALDVVFNPQTTDWQVTYDGRKKEPITLPVKFPMILAQGVEGIAVGLATKILPHNFVELIKASIKLLEGKKTKIYPDFLTGGYIDVSEYNDGLRGGKIKCRAKINQVDKNTLAIVELPFGVTTTSLIDSILKATDKGKIKIKKVIDNTAKDVEIQLQLASGTSPDLTIDALYAFTDCEVSISPNACIIIDNKPVFMGVSELLRICTERTKQLLGMELEIKKRELEEKWHMASLEKIFIQKRIYRDIEECETWEEVLETIDKGLRKYVATPKDGAAPGKLLLMREITEDDLTKLTEIKIKRISKYNIFKADELIKGIEDDLEQVKFDLAHLTEFTIAYFERLLSKYGKGRERKTEIISMESIAIQNVVANNAKLYVNYKDGFIGMGLKKDEFVSDCSDIADVIAFCKDGTYKVVRIADKVFIGKDIIHVAVWNKGDDRTTYNAIYIDGKSGTSYAKRFNVKSITRDKEYHVTKGEPKSKILYFTPNANGEEEIVNIQLSPGCSAKKKVFDFDFGDLAIKGRGSQGNIATKYPVRKISQVSVGKSSLGAIKVWMDEVSGKINTEERGKFIGGFDLGRKMIAIYKDGSYELSELDLNKKYDVNNLIYMGMWSEEAVISAVYYDGDKGWTMVKRFNVETSKLDTKYAFITEHSSSKLYFATLDNQVEVDYIYKEGKEKVEKRVDLVDFIDVKGWKANGNRLLDSKIVKIKQLIVEKPIVEESKEVTSEKGPAQADLFSTGSTGSKDGESPNKDDDLKTGDTIDFDIN